MNPVTFYNESRNKSGDFQSANTVNVIPWRRQVKKIGMQTGNGSQSFPEHKLFFKPVPEGVTKHDLIIDNGERFAIKRFYIVRDQRGRPHHLEIEI